MMKFFMSLHGLHYHWEPSFFVRVLERIDPEHIIDGFEVNGNPDDAYEREFMITLTRHLKSTSRRIQFHSHFGFNYYYNDLDKLNELLTFYHKLSIIYGSSISLVLHPVDSFDVEIAISRTHKLLENIELLTKINRFNLNYTLENLNNTSSHHRLNTRELGDLIKRHDLINFCWDIGHEVSEACCDYQLKEHMASRLSNVHIHDIHQKDHAPFIYGATDYKRSIDYLFTLGYEGSLIVEINIALLEGNSLLEKFKKYMKNIHLLKSYYIESYLLDSVQESNIAD